MDKEESSKEQRILRLMRKTLGNVVRDVTPRAGRPNPLSDDTVQDIKDCFALISERERELAGQLGFAPERPYFRDGAQPSAQVIDFVRPGGKQDDAS